MMFHHPVSNSSDSWVKLRQTVAWRDDVEMAWDSDVWSDDADVMMLPWCLTDLDMNVLSLTKEYERNLSSWYLRLNKSLFQFEALFFFPFFVLQLMFHIFFWIFSCGFHIPFLLHFVRLVAVSRAQRSLQGKLVLSSGRLEIVKVQYGWCPFVQASILQTICFMIHVCVFIFGHIWFGMVWQSLGPFSKALWSFCANAFGDRLAIGGFVSVSVSISHMSHGLMGSMCWGEGKWHHWRSQGRKIQKNSINFLSFFFCFFQFCFWFQFFCLTTSSQKCLIFCCQMWGPFGEPGRHSGGTPTVDASRRGVAQSTELGGEDVAFVFFFHGYIDICVDIWDIYIFFQKFEIQDFSLVVFVVGKPHFERLVAWQLGLLLSATISECVHVKLITWRWHQRKKHMRHVLLLVPRLGEPEPWVNLTNLQMREFSQMMYDG